MKLSGINLSWPPTSRKDECWVPFDHVLFLVVCPTEVQGRAADNIACQQLTLNMWKLLLHHMQINDALLYKYMYSYA